MLLFSSRRLDHVISSSTTSQFKKIAVKMKFHAMIIEPKPPAVVTFLSVETDGSGLISRNTASFTSVLKQTWLPQLAVVPLRFLSANYLKFKDYKRLKLAYLIIFDRGEFMALLV